MAWGDAAAEQYEKDQPSTIGTSALSLLVEFQGMIDGLPPAAPVCGHKHEPAPKTYDDYGPTYAEKVLDADERRGD